MTEPYIVKNLYRNVFKTEPVLETPWPRMILCSVGTLFPLLVGLYNHELSFAIFGAITGHLLSLNDHMGSLLHRLWVTTLSALIIAIGFGLGLHVQTEVTAYYLIIAGVAYWLGLLGGEGAELERAVLFALIGFITAASTPGLTVEFAPRILPYAVLAYAILMIGGPIVYFIGLRIQSAQQTSLRNSLRISFTTKYEKHVHAICFVLTLLFSVWLARRIGFEHGSWITVTILIVLRPDRKLTIYKTLQRFFGTLAGVVIADLVILASPPVAVFFVLVGVCTFVVPWALLRSYALSSLFVTIFVVSLLEIATHHGTLHVATLRLEATFAGCVLSLLGVGLAKMVDRIPKL